MVLIFVLKKKQNLLLHKDEKSKLANYLKS